MTSALTSLSAEYLPAIEAELRTLLSPPDPAYTGHYQMLQYHMGWLDADLRPTSGKAGKRIRPILLMLACEAAGGALDYSIPAAAAVEALHNFSLLHDDIEDASDTRRGVRTVWGRWGVPLAINAGDGLFAVAHLALSSLIQRGVPSERANEAARVFSTTCLDLTHGQHLDMLFEDRLDVSISDYQLMIQGKTAALIAACTQLGALLAGADRDRILTFREFGFHLGIAFQVRDDILGIWGDAATTGKSASSDIETRKKTFPVVFGLERSQQLRDWYAGGSPQPDRVEEIVRLLDELGARDVSEEAAADHHQRALTALDRSSASGKAGEALHELAHNLLMRTS